MVLKLPRTQKRMFWAFEKSIFRFFINFWLAKLKHQKLFKSKFGHRKLLRKWFWSYLELKSECSERLKRAFFSFLQSFERWSWNRFLGKWDSVSKTFCVKSALFGTFRKMLFSFYLITIDNLCYNFWMFWMFWMFPFEYSTGATTMVIILWEFLMFYQIFLSPQVKRSVEQLKT